MKAKFKDLKQGFLQMKILSQTLVVLAVVGCLWFLGATFSPSITTSGAFPEHASEYSSTRICAQRTDSFTKELHDVPRKQVVVRTIPTNDSGLGSVVAQLRSSAAFALALGASFATFGIRSAHLSAAGYRAASLLRLDILETQLDAGTKICSFEASPNYPRAIELVEGWCNNSMLSNEPALELRGMYSDCDLILDDRPWDYRYDMSKCTWTWVKHVFSKLGHKKRETGIGLHIRWGDFSLGLPGEELTPERSTPVEVAAQLLRKIRRCGIRDELSVYMEWHNTTMLSGLGEPYRIVDTNDTIADLIDLASNRLLILDISSWTVLAHQIAEGGVTVVPNIDHFNINWHDNGVNHVLRWQELLSIGCLQLSAMLSS